MTEEAETELETKTVKSQTTSSPNKASPSFKLPAGIPELDKRFPIVRLKPIFAPAAGYQCELCNQNFTNVSHLMKHKQLHEEESSFICEICGKHLTSQADFTEHQRVHEPSFPCNMCDRSFTTSHNLKRHKLLHVKDGRKCSRCGVLFCRRHNHVLFVPQTESEQDSFDIEPESVGSNLMPENDLLEEPEEPEPNQTADLDDDAPSTTTMTPLLKTTVQTVSPTPPKTGPLSKTHKAQHRACYTRIPVPVLLKPSSVPPAPVPRYPRNPGTSSQLRPLPDYPANFIQPHLPQHPELPPSMKIFSPQYLTSALLEVKRDYEYILSKPRDVKKEKKGFVKEELVKEEQCELPLISPAEQRVEHIKEERTAYDLEVML